VSAIYYLDSSAWVKRYFAEAGSSWMHSLFKSELALASTALGYVEVAATIARRNTARQDFPITGWNAG
jgi:predicted nucleic acid-binding protein